MTKKISITTAGDLAKEAFKELYKLQKGEKRLLKSGEEMFDCHIGGFLPGDVITIAGAPGSGKSETLYRMMDKIMSSDINLDSDKFVSLEFSLEMKMLNKMLRKTHTLLNKKKTDILFNEFSEDESEKVKEYFNSLQDGRRFVVEVPLTPLEFYNLSKEFIIKHSDKEAVILSIDHLLLLEGSDKQDVLEKVSEFINLLKLEFKNVYFFILSQLNRSYNSVIKERSNEMIPTNSQLFGSSFMEQLSSYIVIITNPYKQSVSQYLKMNPERYDYLQEFFGEEDNSGRISFNTTGNLFYFVTKVRESDNAWKDLFIKKMDLSKEQLKFMDMKNETSVMKPPSLEIPVFNPIDAFGDDDRPF